jgi:alanine-glyoxylate transaminase/serine-glyoxylate transaminase/serine-pyruvate transaminase
MSGRAVPRLKLLSSHLEPLSNPNTPFATQRTSTEVNSFPPQVRSYTSTRRLSERERPANVMSNQEPHPALLIPGPIEFEDDVLKSMSHFR